MREPLAVYIVGWIVGACAALRIGFRAMWLPYAESRNHSEELPNIIKRVELDSLEGLDRTLLMRACRSATKKVGVVKDVDLTRLHTYATCGGVAWR